MKNILLVLCILSIIWIASASIDTENGPVSISNEKCSGASCYCNTTKNVTSVLSGNTLNVVDLGRIKLAGIICPDISTKEGKDAKTYLESLTINKSICLNVYDSENEHPGTILAVAYLVNPDGSVDTFANVNYLMLDSGSAQIDPLTPGYIKDNIWGTTTNATVEIMGGI